VRFISKQWMEDAAFFLSLSLRNNNIHCLVISGFARIHAEIMTFLIFLL